MILKMTQIRTLEEYVMDKRAIKVYGGESLENAVEAFSKDVIHGHRMKDERGILWPSVIQVVATRGIVVDFFEIQYPSILMVELLLFRTQKDKNDYLDLRDSLQNLIYKINDNNN